MAVVGFGGHEGEAMGEERLNLPPFPQPHSPLVFGGGQTPLLPAPLPAGVRGRAQAQPHAEPACGEGLRANGSGRRRWCWCRHGAERRGRGREEGGLEDCEALKRGQGEVAGRNRM
jgi:hypothetical protein